MFLTWVMIPSTNLGTKGGISGAERSSLMDAWELISVFVISLINSLIVCLGESTASTRA